MDNPGVVFLDHTADVGIGVAAPTLDALFHRAALGMLALLRGEDDEDAGHRHGDTRGTERAGGDLQDRPEDPVRLIALTATALPSLLADWLREILFLHEIDGRDYVAADFETLAWSPLDSPVDSTLRARVRTVPSVGAVREIKGVTYHALRVEQSGGGWEAQVIFDV